MVDRVAVFGASSRIGQAQVRQLQKRGYRTVVVTRDESMFIGPEYANVEVMAADYKDRASLDRVMAAVDAVFFQVPGFGHPSETAVYARNVCEAAVSAKLKRFVHNATMWSPDAPPCGQELYDHVRSIEDLFAISGLSVVIFRPVLFMENILTNLLKPALLEEDVYRYCHRPGLEANWISLDDVARFMIEGLARDELVGQRILLGGPQRLRIEEVVSILSATLGRPITLDYLPARECGEYLFDKLYPAFGTDREAFASFYDSFYSFNNFSPQRPFEVDVDALNRLIPIELTAMRDWAAAQDWSSESVSKFGSAIG